jgi:pyruvate carboxylase
MDVGDEIAIEMERGKTLALRLLAVGDPATNGQRTIFFELNGQPRSVRIHDRNQTEKSQKNTLADKSNPNHVGAPMPGIVSNIRANVGEQVKKGDQLLSIEAMKMETAIKSERDGIIKELLVTVQSQVRGGDLLIIFQD